MSDEKLINNGYQPSNRREERGYQPVSDTQRPNPQSGYQPTSTGSNPTNVPTPPRER